jgi:hypothetical protein
MPENFPVNFLLVISSEDPAINSSVQAGAADEMWDAICQSSRRSSPCPSREFDLAEH